MELKLNYGTEQKLTKGAKRNIKKPKNEYN
jgi:hypothetical protein